MRAKNQRMTLVLLGMGAMLIAALLAMWGLRDRAALFLSPGDLRTRSVPAGQAVRIGGMVRPGSLVRAPDGVSLSFVVGDDTPRTVPVSFRGVPPDLFREGSGVIAEGSFAPDGRFVAAELLAKHDENYKPPDKVAAAHRTETLR